MATAVGATTAAGEGSGPASPAKVVAVCAVVAAASLLVPAALTFDAWAWLVWGREIGRLDLDTTGGPSWKPLPVLVTTIVAPLGSAAVPLFLVAARTGALLAVAGTYRLARRAAGVPAGVVAAALLVLTPDGDPRFLRLIGEGHVAPVSAASALWALDRYLEGRNRSALVLAASAALLRPEAWPFVLAYAVWCWRHERVARTTVAVVLAAIPALWFGFDWWGSGSPLHGADTAQVAASVGVLERLVDAIRVAVSIVPWPVWVGAAAGTVSARRRDERWLLWAVGGAGAWAALVVVMATALGYAALSRFFLPAAAVACALCGIGLARGVPRLWTRRRAVVVVAVLASVLVTLPRIVGVGSVVAELAARAPVEDDLDEVLRLAGRERLLACDDLGVDGVGLLRTAVAWKLDLPLHRVPMDLPDGDGVMLVRTGERRDRLISRQDHTTVVLRSDEWSVLAVRCPQAVDRSPAD